MKALESGSEEYIYYWQYDMNRYFKEMSSRKKSI